MPEYYFSSLVANRRHNIPADIPDNDLEKLLRLSDFVRNLGYRAAPFVTDHMVYLYLTRYDLRPLDLASEAGQFKLVFWCCAVRPVYEQVAFREKQYIEQTACELRDCEIYPAGVPEPPVTALMLAAYHYHFANSAKQDLDTAESRRALVLWFFNEGVKLYELTRHVTRKQVNALVEAQWLGRIPHLSTLYQPGPSTGGGATCAPTIDSEAPIYDLANGGPEPEPRATLSTMPRENGEGLYPAASERLSIFGFASPDVDALAGAGWHGAETGWVWSKAVGNILLPPLGPVPRVVIGMKIGLARGAAKLRQIVRIYLEDVLLFNVTADGGEVPELVAGIDISMFEESTSRRITVVANPTFCPAEFPGYSADARQLGVQLRSLWIRPG